MNNKLKILFVVPGFSMGGTTTALSCICNSKFRDYYDIDIFPILKKDCNTPPLSSYDIGFNELTTAFYADFSRLQLLDKLKYCFIKLLKQNMRLAPYIEKWIIAKTIQKIEQRKQYDYIVGFQEKLATRLASHFSCPHKIAWIHCDYAKTYGSDIDELKLYNQFSKIVCVSHFTSNRFVELYPSLKGRTVAIHNLFDANNVINKSKASIDDLRFNTATFTIISLGRISDVKRFYLIPELAEALLKKDLSFRWFILGSAEPEELKRLNESIKNHSVEHVVLYLGSKVNPYPYLKKADLLVTISKSEACPMIFNEAKILDVPILSSDFGSAFEFIEDGKNGYISTIEGLPQKLYELLSNQDLLKAVVRRDSFLDSNNEILEQLYEVFTL